jgi:hypothetical protein
MIIIISYPQHVYVPNDHAFSSASSNPGLCVFAYSHRAPIRGSDQYCAYQYLFLSRSGTRRGVEADVEVAEAAGNGKRSLIAASGPAFAPEFGNVNRLPGRLTGTRFALADVYCTARQLES